MMKRCYNFVTDVRKEKGNDGKIIIFHQIKIFLSKYSEGVALSNMGIRTPYQNFSDDVGYAL